MCILQVLYLIEFSTKKDIRATTEFHRGYCPLETPQTIYAYISVLGGGPGNIMYLYIDSWEY